MFYPVPHRKVGYPLFYYIPYFEHEPPEAAMTRLLRKRTLLPVELMMILGINLVVIMLSYYAIMMWGFFRG